MRPFTVLIGILLGSAASMSFGLGAVLLVFIILSGRHPELAVEFPKLLMSFIAFLLLTAASAGSFKGQIRARPWRGWAHALTLVCVGILLYLYWPRGNPL
jgi:hypothetical protein